MPEPHFDTYYNYDELTGILKEMANAHPHLFTLESIGQSYEGRDVWCMTATDKETGAHDEKPAFWCDGNIHATEVSASSACLFLLHRLAAGYGTDSEITRALSTRTFYIIPRVNPDGAEAFFASPPRFLRSSTRPYPYDEEALEGMELEDMDGDGRILSMRIQDPSGPWKQHPEHPRLMVRRDPVEEGGIYYRLMPEGTLKNYDGILLHGPRNREGLDLNRNFPSHWRPEKEQTGAGPFPGSEPEAYNLTRFISAHPNITGAITFHTFGGVLLRPYGTQSDESMPYEDLRVYNTLGDKGASLTGYPHCSVFHDFRYHPREVITGVFDDWCYDSLGIFAWTVEIWSPQRHAGILEGFAPGAGQGKYRFTTWHRDHPLEEDIKMLEWSDSNLEGRGYVAWYPFEHPQLGPVEIGGWDVQLAFRNPPVRYLEREIAPLAEWAVWCALVSPRLELYAAEAVLLDAGVYKVRLAVQNTGWLPSYVSKRALERGVVRGVTAEIELPEGAVLQSGKQRVELGQLEGRAYKAASGFGWTMDATAERCVAEWVICGEAGSTIGLTARHDRAGVVRTEVRLSPL